MRCLAFWAAGTCGLLCAAAPQPVRNPFWPVGYEGERTLISPVPRVRKVSEPPPAPETPATPASPTVQEEEKRPTGEATVEEWKAACRQIKVGVVMRARKKGSDERASVVFNGQVCNVGEEVRMPTRRWVFVWRFAGIGAGGVVRLVRLRTQPVVDVPPPEVKEKNTSFFDFIKNKTKD